ncbi:MAG: DUF4474 domain-containing protein [Clostridia bacterium]|nr:DUF4474 domain-containing protein [Clostridia bacterium]
MRRTTFHARLAAGLLALLLLLTAGAVPAFAAQDAPEAEPAAEEPLTLTVSAPALCVTVGQTLQLTAALSDPQAVPERIDWASADTAVATVDGNGLVKGVAVGRADVTAAARVDGQTVKGGFTVCVVTRSNFVKDYLDRNQVLSYRYSYIDDYYYADNVNSWQRNFGYAKYYDLIAPYLLLEYDYIRVFFTYEDKDWMVQCWKGQYGLVFYGAECGIYNKPHSDEADTAFTTYRCPDESDWIDMGMTMYHADTSGNYQRELTCDYGRYWWCTGFKPGHLRKQEPANELRTEHRLTFKDEEMARLFAAGLADCGFKEGENADALGLDQYLLDGTDVCFRWQNISDAENTMPIKISVGVLIFLHLLGILLVVGALLAMGGLFLLILI